MYSFRDCAESYTETHCELICKSKINTHQMTCKTFQPVKKSLKSGLPGLLSSQTLNKEPSGSMSATSVGKADGVPLLLKQLEHPPPSFVCSNYVSPICIC